ncbi:MAG: XisI protein [Saprospiraceae bacterium]|nr:MAG: XisI protein [Saprospiraceae bacterium]
MAKVELQEYAKIKPANQPDVDSYVIADRENNHFQLLQTGWQNHRYVFAVVFHFDIRNGKVWFQRNITDKDVVDELMEMGVAREDIVLGFRSPEMRPHTGFAVA